MENASALAKGDIVFSKWNVIMVPFLVYTHAWVSMRSQCAQKAHESRLGSTDDLKASLSTLLKSAG